jgi:hypothetical protein
MVVLVPVHVAGGVVWGVAVAMLEEHGKLVNCDFRGQSVFLNNF